MVEGRTDLHAVAHVLRHTCTNMHTKINIIKKQMQKGLVVLVTHTHCENVLTPHSPPKLLEKKKKKTVANIYLKTMRYALLQEIAKISIKFLRKSCGIGI